MLSQAIFDVLKILVEREILVGSRQVGVVEQVVRQLSLAEYIILVQHKVDFLAEALLLLGRIFGATGDRLMVI